MRLGLLSINPPSSATYLPIHPASLSPSDTFSSFPSSLDSERRGLENRAPESLWGGRGSTYPVDRSESGWVGQSLILPSLV